MNMSDVAGPSQWMSGSGPLYSIYARICHAIVRGELSPGARLDPEDVSRFAFANQNDIAAALSALANARLLTRDGEAFRVAYAGFEDISHFGSRSLTLVASMEFTKNESM
jgi:DNA-binding GntR family transcriptional regulator